MSRKKHEHRVKQELESNNLLSHDILNTASTPSESKSFIKNFQFRFFHIFIFLGLVSLNLGVSYLVRSRGLYYVANYDPFGFSFGLTSSIFILIFLFLCFVYFKFLQKFPIFSILILAGAHSNFTEKWVLYNNVADYINIYISQFNLADLQIWTGIIMINWYAWFVNAKRSKLT